MSLDTLIGWVGDVHGSKVDYSFKDEQGNLLVSETSLKEFKKIAPDLKIFPLEEFRVEFYYEKSSDSKKIRGYVVDSIEEHQVKLKGTKPEEVEIVKLEYIVDSNGRPLKVNVGDTIRMKYRFIPGDEKKNAAAYKKHLTEITQDAEDREHQPRDWENRTQLIEYEKYLDEKYRDINWQH